MLRRRVGAAAGSLALALGLAGCSGDDPSDEPTVDEVGAHDGQVCPAQLPQEEGPDQDFGPREPAESSPSLASLEEAWVCVYNAVEAGPGPDGNGTTFGWERVGKARALPSSELPALERSLGELTPAAADSACTADLGPRWMLVYTHGTDLTGVVVDDFGCRDVRLTDEPFETVPGRATQAGTVSGVLTGPAELLAALKAGHDG